MTEPGAPLPAGWHTDPAGRAVYRYHDGQRWTEHVSDGQVQGIDPLPPAGGDVGVPPIDAAALVVPSRPPFDMGRVVTPSNQISRRTSTGEAVVEHLGLTGLLLAGACLVALGLFTTSCHVRSRQATRARAGQIGSLISGVKTISADVMDPADIGRVVHLTGVGRGFEPLTDDEVGLTTVALLLERNVSMYQWIETCEGYDVEPSPPRKDEYVESRERRRRRRWQDTPTSQMRTGKRWEKCRYVKGWSDAAAGIRSDRVHLYRNPEFPLTAGTTLLPANQWAVGAFKLPGGRLPESASKSLTALAATPEDMGRLPIGLRRRARIDGGTILVGDVAALQVGDVRIRYRVRYEMPVSIVAERDHWGVNSRALPDGSFYFEVREGTHSAAALMGEGSKGSDHWANHIFQALFVAFGTFLVFWPLHVWGRSIPGPALLTGAGVLVFVPLVTAAIYAGLLVHLWWDKDRSAALVALVVMAGSGALLLVASAVRQMTRATPS